jgi:hypothetical protein
MFRCLNSSLPAGGRRLITQEIGFTKNYGGKKGLLSFRTMDEVADAVKRIDVDDAKHSRAALDVAREVFEAENVLELILDGAGI